MELTDFTDDLTEEVATDIERYRAFGREQITKRMRAILNQDIQSSIVLTGEPGVGKTAIVENLAVEMLNANEKDSLYGKHILKLDLTRVNDGHADMGDYAYRFGNFIAELKNHRDDFILFIDEMHQIVGTGAKEGSLQDVANMLKPALSRGEIQVIGATTIDEFHATIEKDGALMRRLEEVTVPELTEAETVELLKSIKWQFSRKQDINISDEILVNVTNFANRYISDRYFPDKAIGLLDGATSLAKMNGHSELELADLAEIVHDKFNIPMSILLESVNKRLLTLEDHLKSRVIGQDEAIGTVVNRIWSRSAGLGDMSKPLSFFFAGPTGVGKTETAKALAEAMFGSESAMIRLDMSEYKIAERAVPRFKSVLSRQVKKMPYTVLLLDEAEKADSEVMDLLLQVLDDGRLTDDYGRQVNFKDVIVIMTSNASAELILTRDAKGATYQNDPKRQKAFMEEFKSSLRGFGFKPEFIARIGNIIMFHPLQGADIAQVVDLKLQKLNKQANKQGFQILYRPKDVVKYIPTFDKGYELDSEGNKVPSSPVVDLLIDKGYELSEGVRPLDETINNLIEPVIADAIMLQRISGEPQRNTFIFRAYGEGPKAYVEGKNETTTYGTWEVAVGRTNAEIMEVKSNGDI
ncbi:ATPase with chaperone activity, ATP-binding subunit [Weissella oryzae SG25]|uniref:ATPase with chaperone activity, ATP-binding subunit n=1 Tax=Weissella oryzae (strain DSM 25784 / JCM 18191 / LMG 30913 / SG25) TaxID=1329250 RepID=A0A069CUS2_WEIOS|nr:ATP-dependent Clp protease ATP-binding subunit [Weissella oryzae]GAK31555.1 ATPase with chaperone activity, ATP-binding subunit [Weissella oryzae SG25]